LIDFLFKEKPTLFTFTRSLQRNNGLSTGFCRVQARKNPRGDRVFFVFMILLSMSKNEHVEECIKAKETQRQTTNNKTITVNPQLSPIFVLKKERIILPATLCYNYKLPDTY